MKAVLDASAILAYLQSEPGSETIEDVLSGAAVSSVNWSEVVQKTLASKIAANNLRDDFEALGVRVHEFTADDAETAAALWQATRNFGLSLADRACLSLGMRLSLQVWTTDRNWARLKIKVPVRVVR